MPRFSIPSDVSNILQNQYANTGKQQQGSTAVPELKTPQELKKVMKETKKAKEKLEDGFLQNITKEQWFKLIRASQEEEEEDVEDEPDVQDSVDGGNGSGQNDGDYDDIDVFNHLFEAIDETRKKTDEMAHTFNGMNTMAATLLAAQGGGLKKEEPSNLAQQAKHQRALIGNNLLQNQLQNQQENQAQAILGLLTESLAPLLGGGGVSAETAPPPPVDEPPINKTKKPKIELPKSAGGVNKTRPASLKRQQLQNHIERFRRK